MAFDSKKHIMVEEEQEHEQNSALFKRRKGKEEVDVIEAPPLSSSSSYRRKFPRRMTINFKLNNQARFLTQVLESLTDSKLNPEHLGMVEVNTAKGFQITVENQKTKAVAYLILCPAKLINFRCSKPLVPHLVDLDSIFDFLLDDSLDDDDTLFIAHTQAAPPNQYSHLFFKSFTESSDENGKFPQLLAPLIPLKGDPLKFPDEIRYFCFASIPSVFLHELLHKLEETQLVLMVVKSGLVEMYIRHEQDGWKLKWQITCSSSSYTTEGMQCDAYFKLNHAKSIWTALPLDPNPFIYFLSEPESHILFRFNLQGRGDLVFLSKAIRLDRRKSTVK